MYRPVPGPPPVPLRARNKSTEAHIANATVADNLSIITVLAFIGLFVGFMALLLLLGAF